MTARKFARLLVFLLLSTAWAVAEPVHIGSWTSGVFALKQGWKTHSGDNPAWAASDFGDSGWETIANLSDYAGNQYLNAPGYRWFRITLSIDNPQEPFALHILARGGGTQVWVNGQLQPQPQMAPPLLQRFYESDVLPLPPNAGKLQIAIRTRTFPYTSSLSGAALDLAEVGSRDLIAYRARMSNVLMDTRFTVSFLVDLALLLAGCGLLILYRLQPADPGYLWLGLYMAVMGLDDIAYQIGTNDIGSVFFNAVLGDPGCYLVLVLMIEFVFRFVAKPKPFFWRLYQWISLAIIPAGLVLNLTGTAQPLYLSFEAVWTLIPAFALPAQIYLWARRGSREALWLVLPVFSINFLNGVQNLASTANFFLHIDSALVVWANNPFQFREILVRKELFGSVLFLVSISAVMVLRFQHLSQSRARATAELEAAQIVQRRLVSERLPSVPGCHVEVAYYPATEVGGDFCQVLPLASGATLFVIGDVSGKGLQAAMTGTLILGALHAIVARSQDPGEILTALNRELCNSTDGGFTTCLILRIDADGLLTAANAGHLAPYLDGVEVPLESSLPLGMNSNEIYPEARIQLSPGNQLTLLTDGVLEARKAAGELFGFDRIAAISQQPAETIANAAKDFGQEDDITVLTLSLAF
jgi:serine phosphatase RsbU (regulator of sigma subunit)